MSNISEVNKFFSRKAWMHIRRSEVKPKGRNRVPVMWVLNIKEVPGVLIYLMSRNVDKGYMQVP